MCEENVFTVLYFEGITCEMKRRSVYLNPQKSDTRTGGCGYERMHITLLYLSPTRTHTFTY
jgi:hypothetical protein